MFSPSCLSFNSCLNRSTWRALFGTAGQLFSTKPLLLSVPIDVVEVSFPLTGPVMVRPGYCVRPVILDGFLWGWPFIVAGGTALIRGWRFLFRLFLFHFLGWFALAGSQR